MKTKKCSNPNCLIYIKPVSKFYKDKKQKDGLNPWCKQCCQEYNKQYRDQNKEKLAIQAKEKYTKNKYKIQKYKKEYHDKNFEKLSKQQKEYYELNKEKILIKQKEYNDKNKEKLSKQKQEHRDNNKEKLFLQNQKSRKKNKEKIVLRQKEYYKQNIEKILQRSKRQREENKEQIKQYKIEYNLNNKDKINNYHKNRAKTDINFKIKRNLRTRMHKVLKGINKSLSTMFLIGCETDYLMYHLQCQFQPNMTWDNYGLNGWEIDHIKPCASFDLSKKSEQLKCFNYKNLQPLWAIDNLKKGCKI